MPLSDKTIANGSETYCSYCFVDGKLIADQMTLQEFQNKAYRGMISHGKNQFLAWAFSKMIRFAPYWKTR
jgi:hypothetical protein